MAHQVLEAYQLGTGEKKDYSIDLTSELNTGETVQSVALVVEPPDSDLTITGLTNAAGIVTFFASTPNKATRYDITARGTLSNTRIVENSIAIGGIEKAHGSIAATWP